MEKGNYKISKTRRIYFVRLIARCIVLLLTGIIFFLAKDQFDVVKDLNFFKEISVFHILWAVWMVDMIMQLMPVRAYISIGSQKQFSGLFRPIKEKINKQSLKKYLVDTTLSAYKVMAIWLILTSTISILYLTGVIDYAVILIISTVFYVCDLICVLIWCPFRLIMGNKCCTTCRIFNWDHLMMFSPFIAVRGFFSWSLFAVAFAIWLVWEICVFTHPERFWENSNMALKCSECTDKLCTQYCRRLRKIDNKNQK